MLRLRRTENRTAIEVPSPLHDETLDRTRPTPFARCHPIRPAVFFADLTILISLRHPHVDRERYAGRRAGKKDVHAGGLTVADTQLDPLPCNAHNEHTTSRQLEQPIRKHDIDPTRNESE